MFKTGQKWETRKGELAMIVGLEVGSVNPLHLQIGKRPFMNCALPDGRQFNDVDDADDDLVSLISEA